MILENVLGRSKEDYLYELMWGTDQATGIDRLRSILSSRFLKQEVEKCEKKIDEERKEGEFLYCSYREKQRYLSKLE